jgi:hypothetical protein
MLCMMLHWLSAFANVGALVAGPGADDIYVDALDIPRSTSIGVHFNIPLIGTLGGLIGQKVSIGQCAAGQGMFQLLQASIMP